MLRFCKNFRLILFDPQNFRRGESRQRHIAGDADKFFFANGAMDFITLTLRALVIPQNGRT